MALYHFGQTLSTIILDGQSTTLIEWLERRYKKTNRTVNLWHVPENAPWVCFQVWQPKSTHGLQGANGACSETWSRSAAMLSETVRALGTSRIGLVSICDLRQFQEEFNLFIGHIHVATGHDGRRQIEQARRIGR